MGIVRLHLADLTLPEFHPLYPQPCAVYAYLVDHPDGPILVDSGVGSGSELIERLYTPRCRPVEDALRDAGVEPRELAAVVNTHLHFDHCGQNARLPGVPIYVQRAEREAARARGYTVPEWVEFPGARLEEVEGERAIARGVRLIPSPGHTPGHQSVLVESGGVRELVCGQAAYTAVEFERGGDEDDDRYLESVRALRALRPSRAYFSHDASTWAEPD